MSAAESPFSIPAIRRFIAFRIGFNARFYYPIFTILFLDFGLTIEQFAVLNAAWAASIVLFEVPSGALADVIGRKRLVVTAAGLMVVEIAILTFAPRGDATLLFALFLVNRILSGVAEAAASGADEALAYDALAAEGLAEEWGRVLERQMRLRSAVAVCAMMTGAAVYDPELMTAAARAVGLDVQLTQADTLRLPLILTLLMSGVALRAALGMDEPKAGDEDPTCGMGTACRQSFGEAFRMTFRAGAWILKTPFALIIILAGLLFDHVIRMLITLNSQYFRLIDLPEASFGLIGGGMAVLGLFIPRLALALARHNTPRGNLWLLSALTLAGLYGMTWFIPYYGLIPMLLLFSVMLMSGFFVSHYLNRITDSRQRATVLSFKGLSFNLAYGFIGLLYSAAVATIRSGLADGTGEAAERTVFVEAMAWFPGYFCVALILFGCFAAWRLSGDDAHRRRG